MISTSKRSALTLVTLVSLVGLTAVAAGCTAPADDGTVTPRLEVINKTKSALSANSITSVTGTYSAACGGRSSAGTDAWTVDITTPANSTLTVQKNNIDCVLTVKNVVTAAGAYIGSPAIALDTTDTWQASGSSFALSGGSRAFYGNAKISARTFAADFLISILVSDDASATAAGASPVASFATQAGTASEGHVAASQYTLGFGAMAVQKDTNNVVVSTSGYAQLAIGGVTGEDYAIVAGNMAGSSFAAVDSAFAGATRTGLLSGLTTLQLPAAWFTLETNDLDTATYRTVIIRHTVNGVAAYQYFSVLFQ